jgi:hypothetical protein
MLSKQTFANERLLFDGNYWHQITFNNRIIKLTLMW